MKWPCSLAGDCRIGHSNLGRAEQCLPMEIITYSRQWWNTSGYRAINLFIAELVTYVWMDELRKGQRVNTVPRSSIWWDKTFHYRKWPQGWRTKVSLLPLGGIRTEQLSCTLIFCTFRNLMLRFDFIIFTHYPYIYSFLSFTFLCKIFSQSKYAQTCIFTTTTTTTNQLRSYLPDSVNTDVSSTCHPDGTALQVIH